MDGLDIGRRSSIVVAVEGGSKRYLDRPGRVELSILLTSSII